MQAGYGYDGQSDYHHPPQQQSRGRGHRPRQPNITSNAYYHGQQVPNHLQHQQLPSQQHISHQLPGGQQHVGQQGSRQSSQHVSSQSSPPMVARSHPQTQDLPRYDSTQVCSIFFLRPTLCLLTIGFVPPSMTSRQTRHWLKMAAALCFYFKSLQNFRPLKNLQSFPSLWIIFTKKML